MTKYNSDINTWTCFADPKYDVVPMGSYIGTEIFKQLARRDPKEIAYFNHDTGESISIKEIRERTVTVAKNLRSLGIGKNDILGLFSRNNSYTSSIAFGSFLNGNPWCPFDTNQDDSMLDFTLKLISPSLLIVDKQHESAVKKSLERLNLQKIKCIVYGDPQNENSIENVLLKPQDLSNFEQIDLSKYDTPDNLTACIYFSSGTTGKPKAVKITHSMIVNSINGYSGVLHYTDPNVNMMSVSALHSVSQLSGLYIPIFFGSKITFSGKDVNDDNICSAIDKWKVTGLFGSNQILCSIFDHYRKTSGYDLKSLRVILTGGETPSKAINEEFQRTFAGRIRGSDSHARGFRSH